MRDSSTQWAFPIWVDHLGPYNNKISWAQFISLANLAAFFIHLGGFITAWLVNLQDGDVSKPSIDIYTPSINFTVTQGDNGGAGFELRPELQKSGTLSLRALAMSFFFVSALFHLVIVLDVEYFKSFYFQGLATCMAPARWIECVPSHPHIHTPCM